MLENQTSFKYNGTYYYVRYDDGQSYENQWGVGSHMVTASLMGVETTYNINIIESPYKTIEILNVAPIMDCEYSSTYNGKPIYDIPAFSYRITSSDGSSHLGYYGMSQEYFDEDYVYLNSHKSDQLVQVSSNQYTNPWTVGGDNYFTVSYTGVKVDVKVDIKPSSPWEYYVDNGEVYITGHKIGQEKMEIPSEIDGMPVVAVLGFNYNSYAVKELVIPNSIRTIGQNALWAFNQLERITIGSGVSYLDASMFWLWNLKEICVSDANPYYSSKDGILYDKEGTTIVAYPRAKGANFTVPANVINADIMFSEYKDVELTFEEGSKAYIKEDGVLYAANKTKVISCDKDKSGEYIMPDSVTEIADCAFEDCAELTNVVVSQNVYGIGRHPYTCCYNSIPCFYELFITYKYRITKQINYN